MNLRRSAGKLFVANAANSAIVFAGITLFARELGAAAMGTYFLYRAVLGISTVPVDLGIRGAVAKRISEGEAGGPVLSSAALLKVVPLAVAVVAVLAARESVDAYLGAPLAGLLAVGMVLQQASRLMIKVLNGERRVGETATLKFADKVTWVLVAGGLALGAGMGARGLVIGALAGRVVVLGWGLHKRDTPFGRPSVASARSVLDYSRYNAVSAMSFNVFGWLDVAIIGLFLGQAAVGVYEIAWRVTGVVILFSKAIATTIFPEVSRLDAAGERDRIERILAGVLTPSLFFVIPAFFGAVLVGREVLTVVFGAEYAAASLVLVVLMGQKLFFAVRRIFNRALQAIDRPDLAARSNVASVLANLLLNVALVPTMGILGAAVATTSAFALDTAMHAGYLSRFLHVEVPVDELAWCVLASAGMAVLLVGVESVVVIDSLPALLGVVGGGAVVYGLLVAANPALRGKIVRNTRRLAS